MREKDNRVVFYSKNDMAVWFELNKIEKLLTDINLSNEFDINDFLEFYSIKTYFDNELFLEKWGNDSKEEYIELSNKLYKQTATYFNCEIDNSNIKEIINSIQFDYIDFFFELFNKFKLYEKIESWIIINLLEEKSYLIEYLLKYKKIVYYYDNDIKLFLESYDKTTELFLSKLEWSKLYFPESLTHENKESIVIGYLESSLEENMNKLEHISKLRDGDFLQLSWKTKLKAKKKYQETVEKFFEWDNSWLQFAYTIWLSEKQEEDVVVESSNPLEPKISYSIHLFDKLYQSDGISYLFRSIFSYLDDRWNIELVSRKSEISVLMDLLSSNVPWEYQTWPQFQFKEIFSILNMVTFINYLKNFHDKNLTLIIEYFISNLRLYNWFEKALFKTESIDKIDDYADMIKIIMPAFDLFIKQFISYVNESEIDFELIWMQDGFLYKNIPSLLEKKYFYAKDEEIKNLKYHFFSDQSGLFYIKWYEERYENFYKLITKENLKIDNFVDYQIKVLKLLIKDGILYVDEDDYIRIKNRIFIFLVWEIYKKGVISYYWYDTLIQKEILEMEKGGYLYSESTLLSHLESSYFNYYLNDSEFVNSYWIRNKNMHWYYYWNENMASNDFMVIMKLIVLIFLKIEDELYIVDKS